MDSETRIIIRQFMKNRLSVFGLAVAISLLLIAIFGSFISPHDPLEINLTNKFQPGFWEGNYENILGTDNLGRDIFSRILHGAGISLRIGYIVVGATALVGIFLGVISGFFGKTVDIVIMRIMDIFLAFPSLLLALVIAATLGAGIEKAMIAITIVYIPGMARIVRGSVLAVKQLPYVESSRTIGAGNLWIVVKHILPNILTPIIVYATLLLADTILATAALGFLGIGIEPSTPEWGAMLSGGREFILMGQWWITVFPGIMIILAVLSFNLLGDGIREAIDSKLRQ